MYTRNSRNKFDRKDSQELGQKAEQLFVKLARREGWIVRNASKKSNINDHYDYEIQQGRIRYRVDVKSIKRLSRVSDQLQDDLIWVEFKSVRGSNGWLFGNADLIAFEDHRGFRIVERKSLVRVINKMVDLQSRVGSPAEALYKVYTRDGRPDEITLIQAKDIESILWGRWIK